MKLSSNNSFSVSGLDSTNKAASILIAEPEELFRSALTTLVESLGHYSVRSAVSNVDEILQTISSQSIDLIISEANLSGRTPVDLVYEFNRREIKIPILILTGDCSPQFVKQAIVAGVKGLMLKKNSAEAFGSAIRALLNGENYYCIARE